MNVSIRKVIGVSFIVALFAVASLGFSMTAKAQTNTAQFEQIQTLLKLLAQLQAQLAQMQGGGVGSGLNCIQLSRALYVGLSDNETGGDVTKLQRFLGVNTTGFFGPVTEQKLKEWQARKGIVSSGDADTTGYGLVGQKTRALMAVGCGDVGIITSNPEGSESNRPVANAGSDRIIYAPTNSVAPRDQSVENSEYTTVIYSWALRERDEGTSVPIIVNAKTLTPTFNSLTVGEYIFRLTVTDNLGRKDTDDMKVIVKPITSNPEGSESNRPVANAGSDRIIYAPTNSVAPRDQSVENSEYTTVIYSWALRERDEGTSVPIIVNAKTLTPTFNSLTVGEYIFRLTVTDNLGRKDTDDMKVIVKPITSNPG